MKKSCGRGWLESFSCELCGRFSKFGPVKNLRMLWTKDGYFRGKGIVEFGSVASATASEDSKAKLFYDQQALCAKDWGKLSQEGELSCES